MDRPDRIDEIASQWAAERPELDVSALALVGRLFRTTHLIDDLLSRNLARHGLRPGWFDLLAALRRTGDPYELSPGRLIEETLLSSAGMTKRLDRMAEAGLVHRRPDPQDRRGVLVGLTERGKRVVEEALVTHLAAEDHVLGGLAPTDRRALDRLLRKLLAGLEPGER